MALGARSRYRNGGPAIKLGDEGNVEDIDARSVIAAIPLFAETLNSRQLDHLAAQCEPVFFPAGTFTATVTPFTGAGSALVSSSISAFEVGGLITCTTSVSRPPAVFR